MTDKDDWHYVETTRERRSYEVRRDGPDLRVLVQKCLEILGGLDVRRVGSFKYRPRGSEILLEEPVNRRTGILEDMIMDDNSPHIAFARSDHLLTSSFHIGGYVDKSNVIGLEFQCIVELERVTRRIAPAKSSATQLSTNRFSQGALIPSY